MEIASYSGRKDLDGTEEINRGQIIQLVLSYTAENLAFILREMRKHQDCINRNHPIYIEKVSICLLYEKII